MKRYLKISCAVLIASTCVALFVPGFSWSLRCRQTFTRIASKTAARLARLRGHHPQAVSLKGVLSGMGALEEEARGARVSAIESTSGYGAMTDSHGGFLLPNLVWYPRASYKLFIVLTSHRARTLSVDTSECSATGGIVNIGTIRLEDSSETEINDIPVRYMTYDAENLDYYAALFRKLAHKANTDDERIDAVCKYVASKLNYNETAWSFRTPREIIERGSCYCSNLALAMAALTETGNYPTRTVHLSDGPDHVHTHVVVEVYYGDQWHLYDPTFGVAFSNERERAVSYRQIRLDPSLVNHAALKGIDPKTAGEIMGWMPQAFASGLHQLYYTDRNEICPVW